MTVLVVMPARNEAASIAPVVADLIERGYKVAVVDDASTDGTGACARGVGAIVLPMPVSFGIGGALRCGFRYAVEHGHRTVVQVDADGQHRGEDIAALLDAQQATGAHLVVGSRFAPGAGHYDVNGTRRAAMRMLSRVAGRAAGTTLTDATSGLRAITEPLLGEFARSYTAHYMDSFEALIVAGRGGYTIAEVPVTMLERASGTSSASPLAALAFLGRGLLVATARLGFPIRAAAETVRR